MVKLDVAEISMTGDKLVEDWLINNGFSNVLNKTGQTGANGIEANGTIENILVLVNTSMEHAGPGKITDDDKVQLKLNAAVLTRKAYIAYVVIDPDKNIVGEIVWQRLS
jgi:hypothetical protein